MKRHCGIVISRLKDEDLGDWKCSIDVQNKRRRIIDRISVSDPNIVNVAKDFLLQTCDLDERFEISFEVFIKTGTFGKGRNILSILDDRNHVLIALDTRRKRRIRIKGLADKVVKVSLNQWNSFKIVQDRQRNRVSPKV